MWQRVEVGNGRDTLHARKALQQPCRQRHHHDSHQRTRDFLAHKRRSDNQRQRQDTYPKRPPVHILPMLGIAHPLVDEVRRRVGDTQAEEVVHLRREDGYRDTRREADNHRIRHELDDISQLEYAHDNQQDTRHDSGYQQSCQPMLLDNAVDNHDKRTRRAPYLHLAAAECRDDETRDNRRYQALRRTHARRDTEGDCQRDSHNTDNDSCHCVLQETLLVVAFHARKQLRSKHFLK